MKVIYLITILALCMSCASKQTDSDKKDKGNNGLAMNSSNFQTILDSAHLDGSILIHHLEQDRYYSNDFDWANKGHLPASTFKIANSIIALETGVVNNDSTLFKWDGSPRSYPVWEQDLIFRDAYHYSCVPCFQEVARSIGTDRMTDYLNKLNYGSIEVDSSNVDMFWLTGESKISQYQQIDFLKRFYKSKLPITDRTDTIMKRMIVMEENDEYKLSGKTGWSTSNGDNGWFVGYIESNDQTYFFATNVEPKEGFDMNQFPMIRKSVTFEAFKKMNIIK